MESAVCQESDWLRLQEVVARRRSRDETGDSLVRWRDLPVKLSLETEESLSYVCARPMNDMEAVKIKAESLALLPEGSKTTSSKKVKSDEERLTEITCGAALADPTPKPGKKKVQKLRRVEREKTKGADWFHMPAPEMTEEKKRDLEVLRMRSVIDPKRFYKKNDTEAPPKYFQIGKVIDSPADFYTDRVAKKKRRSTLVDELMADAEFRKYNKRKYTEIIEEKARTQRRYQGRPKKKRKGESGTK